MVEPTEHRLVPEAAVLRFQWPFPASLLPKSCLPRVSKAQSGGSAMLKVDADDVLIELE